MADREQVLVLIPRLSQILRNKGVTNYKISLGTRFRGSKVVERALIVVLSEDDDTDECLSDIDGVPVRWLKAA